MFLRPVERRLPHSTACSRLNSNLVFARNMRSTLPDASLPRVSCDFNALGWSGEADDHCYYAFDQKALATLEPSAGLRLIAFMDEGGGEVLGCEAVLERFGTSWRVRPDESSWFRGQLRENDDA